jgi:hypothetical protein
MMRFRCPKCLQAALAASLSFWYAVQAVTSPAAPAVPLGTSMFAAVNGDGHVVNFSWWVVAGATGGYELQRSTDPQGSPETVATIPVGTTGATDPHPASSGMYYRLVAIGAKGARSEGAWVLVNTPTVTGLTVSGADVVVAWSTLKPAPAGYEIWRTADPSRTPVRVGSVAAGTMAFTDKQAAGGNNFYQVAALGGGARAASTLVQLGGSAGSLAGPVPPSAAASTAPAPPSPPGPAAVGPNAFNPKMTAQLPSGVAAPVTSPPQALALPGGSAPGASVSSVPSTPASAPPPAATSLLPPAPSITGLLVQSTTPVAHVIQWDCVKNEWLCGTSSTINAAGSAQAVPVFDYAISSRAPGATGFDPVTPTAPIAGFGDCVNPPQCTQGVVHIKANLKQYIAPNTTFHVVRTDRKGKQLPASADFLYASPPQPQQPGSFTATETPFGQVNLSWSPVPNATGYLIIEKGSTAALAQVSSQTTVLTNISPGTHTYQIASDYGVPVPAVGLPEAKVLVHRVPPPRGVPFLTKNNGPGSDEDAAKHLTYSGLCAPDPSTGDCGNLADGFALNDAGGFFILNTGVAALYANVTELALGRSVKCWELYSLAGLTYTVPSSIYAIACLASNHGALVGAATPNASALAAAAASGTSFAAVGMIFDTRSRTMTFLNFIPATGATELPDPNTSTQGDGWHTARAAALDSEGAKFLPHVCLPCHGGTFHTDTGEVSGATFLPVDPSLVAFSNLPGHDRASTEDAVRGLNSLIMASSPPQPISDYINGMYPGKTLSIGPAKLLPVDQPGTVAQANYVPAGWAQQADFFKKVVKPNCLMCHLATSSPTLVFDSADKFFANKALIYAAVCVGRSMPNAELPYNNLWSSLGPSGTVSDGPAATLAAALGHSSCP